MVQGAGGPYADTDSEFAGGEPRAGVRVRHCEALSGGATDHIAPFKDSARDAVRAIGAARNVHVLPGEPELPRGISTGCTTHYGRMKQQVTKVRSFVNASNIVNVRWIGGEHGKRKHSRDGEK
jgi:hypothetical protein